MSDLTKYRQDDFGLIAYSFTISAGDASSIYVLPDWDDSLRVEIYDFKDNLRDTYKINTSPAIYNQLDEDGNPYIYVDEVDLIDFELGNAYAKIYANYGGSPWEEYPIEEDFFEVVFYQARSKIHPKALLLKLRRFLRDHAELNRIIHSEETSDRMMRESLRYALDEYNATPPIMANITEASYPAKADNILIHLAACYVLESVLALRARNRLSYNDSGFSVDEEQAVIAEERLMLEYYFKQARLSLDAFKISLSVSMGWGGPYSDYSTLGYNNPWDYSTTVRREKV